MPEPAAPTRTPAAAAYDEFAYPGFAFPQTRPDRLYSVARLYGLRPAPPAASRCIELGCGDGTNLLAMAVTRPGGEFVGIDASARAIATANALVRATGLANVEFKHLDLDALQLEPGSFDYVVAHGLYSWVPPRTRDALLTRCRDLLASDGVAYVSYNAYPGAFLHDMLREVLDVHIDGSRDATERLAQARWLAEVIVAAGVPTPHGRALAEQMAALLERSDALVYHDDLAAVNTPVFFREFLAHAGAHGLQFLAEADFLESQALGLSPVAEQALERLPPDVLVREQYLDLVRNRAFRQTLLCHRGLAIDHDVDPGRLEELALASRLRPIQERPNLEEGMTERFETPAQQSVETADPLAKAALIELAEVAPGAVPFAELEARVRARLSGGSSSRERADELAPILLELCFADMVELWSEPPPLAAEPDDRPRASELARAQAACGLGTVATLAHTNVTLEDDLGRALVDLLDGERDRQALLRELGTVAPRVLPAGELPEALDASLRRLAELGLLRAADAEPGRTPASPR